MSRKVLICGAVALISVLLDQGTKYLAVQNIRLDTQQIHVFDSSWISLSLVQAQNPGAAFSILEGKTLFFVVFSVVAVVVLVRMLRELPATDRLQSAAIGLILSGAIGNGLDRLMKQTVTDFIRVYTENGAARAWLSAHDLPNAWPIFNVADAALVVGLGLFFVHYLFLEKDKDSAVDPPAHPLNEDGTRTA